MRRRAAQTLVQQQLLKRWEKGLNHGKPGGATAAPGGPHGTSRAATAGEGPIRAHEAEGTRAGGDAEGTQAVAAGGLEVATQALTEAELEAARNYIQLVTE